MPGNLGRIMASNTERLINGKLHLQPSLQIHTLSCSGPASVKVHKHLKLTIPQSVFFFLQFFLFFFPPVLLFSVSGASQMYRLPEEFVKILNEGEGYGTRFWISDKLPKYAFAADKDPFVARL